MLRRLLKKSDLKDATPAVVIWKRVTRGCGPQIQAAPFVSPDGISVDGSTTRQPPKKAHKT